MLSESGKFINDVFRRERLPSLASSGLNERKKDKTVSFILT